MKTGKVYLVGAGPGDPGLFTLKGKECMEEADVVIYDYLAAPALLSLASEKAEKIYVGKKGGDHTLSQEGINQLIVEKARAGNKVVRLKGGDPFIFGRGGEEAEVLKASDIPFEVVPGVTAGIAAASYAGIPLTHRRYSASLAFVTGNEDPDKEDSNIDWEALSRIGTLVFYMGVRNLGLIVAKLKECGRSGKTPVALIRWGSTSLQETISADLDTIQYQVEKQGFKAPAIIVVGEVVELREKLAWFEKQRPLLGKKVLVTRAREQASQLVSRLTDLGASCIEMPTIRIEEEEDKSLIDKAIDNLKSYDWLIFTSVNGLKFFFKRLFERGLDVRALHKLKTACVGPVTAEGLMNFGISCDILPESYRAESIVAAFENEDILNKRVLIPKASEARSVLPDSLRKMGALVEELKVYTTFPSGEKAEKLISLLEKKELDFITFTSSSTVKNFKDLIPSSRFEELTGDLKIISIGPITSQTAVDLGFSIYAEAEEYTISGMLELLCQKLS